MVFFERCVCAGFLCSHTADTYAQTTLDTAAHYTSDTSARCVPCAHGEFCPAGSYEGEPAQAEAYALARQCPSGSFCPDAASAQQCAAGTYCVEGSSEQYSCNYTQLLLKDAQAKIPTEQPTVLERIYLQGDPLGGNYCPAGADTPLTRYVLLRHVKACKRIARCTCLFS